MSRFICPRCERSAFYAIRPMFTYTPRRWLAWLPPVKTWVGDLVCCANAACSTMAVAGPGGVVRIEPPPAAPENANANPDGEPQQRRVAPYPMPDSDMKWFREHQKR